MDLITAGDVGGVLDALSAQEPAERARWARVLAEHRAELGHGFHRLPDEERRGRSAAEFAAQPDPPSMARWVVEAHEENFRFVERTDGRYHVGQWVVQVVDHWPAEWRAALVPALGEVMKEMTFTAELFPLADYLIRGTGCPPPTSIEFVHAWLRTRRDGGDPALVPDPPGDTLAERLGNDPLARHLMPVALADLPVHYLYPPVLIELAATGVISRDDAFGAIYHWLTFSANWSIRKEWIPTFRMLGEDPEYRAVFAPYRTRYLSWFTREVSMWAPDQVVRLELLAPDLVEHAAMAQDYLALLTSHAPVATHLADRLADLDEAGLADPDVLTTTTERILERTDKKVMRSHLIRINRTARRDRTRARQVVLAAAAAFHHPDALIQEQALKIVARHLDAASAAGQSTGTHSDEQLLDTLRTAAAALTPAHRDRATALFGSAEGGEDEPYVEILPEIPVPAAVPGPLAAPAEVAEHVAAVLARGDDIVIFELALDGLVRHAYLDRAALASALAPVVRRRPRVHRGAFYLKLWEVARAVIGESEDRLPDWARGTRSPMDQLLTARLGEAASAVVACDLPFLLAVPTDSTGALDAGVLVDRLASYADLGVTARPNDFAQSLLRVTPTADDRVLDAAGKLRCDAGRRLSAWLRAGGYPHQPSTPDGWQDLDSDQMENALKAQAGRSLAEVAHRVELPSEVVPLFDPKARSGAHQRLAQPYWAATLPHHRDELAAAYERGWDDDQSAWISLLPALAESGGPADFVLHWSLTLALDAGPDDHGPAADAILVLTARGQLDGDLFGRQFAKRTALKEITLSRAAEVLRAMADTGAYATVWSICRAALPGLLAGKPAAGVGRLLTLATECALRCRARGEIPEVTAVAGRRGSSELIKSARALVQALTA